MHLHRVLGISLSASQLLENNKLDFLTVPLLTKLVALFTLFALPLHITPYSAIERKQARYLASNHVSSGNTECTM